MSCFACFVLIQTGVYKVKPIKLRIEDLLHAAIVIDVFLRFENTEFRTRGLQCFKFLCCLRNVCLLDFLCCICVWADFVDLGIVLDVTSLNV